MRLTTKAAVAAAAAMVTLASPAGAQTPPQLPDLPKGDVERFQMTIRGVQRGDFKFNWTPGNACNWHAEGTLLEHWEYARGKAVVMEFNKIAPGVVLLRRVGRPPGDAAFASPGSVTRDGSGFFDMGPEGCGGMHSFAHPDCGKRFPVQSDLRLLWLAGKLTLERSGHKFRANPADDCGQPEGAINFDGLTFPYPLFARQHTALPARKIFGRARGFKLQLKDKFLEPVRDGAWGDSSESLSGSTQLTFKRMRSR